MNDETKAADAPAEKARMKKVTLKAAHKHRGEWHQPGDKIEVRPDQEDRLRRDGKI